MGIHPTFQVLMVEHKYHMAMHVRAKPLGCTLHILPFLRSRLVER